MHGDRGKSGIDLNTMKNLPDFQPDLYGNLRIKLTRLQYQIFYFLTKKNLSQKEIAKKLNLAKQTVNEYVKKLIILGAIKENKKSSYPKYYKPTYVVPITDWTDGKNGNVIIGKHAKTPERRVCLPYKAVRNKKTGRFKGTRRPRGVGFHRDYDTVISIGGKRIPVLRVHSPSYACTILREPAEKVPWEEKGGPNGMNQYVYHHTFSNKKSEIDELRELDVTFVRKKTATYDELIIYMPEKYLFEHELKASEKIMEEFCWVARKWFQNKFKTWLSLALPYRPMEIARELFDPTMKQYVAEKGMLKVKTKLGYAMADESKKGFPEIEYNTTDEMEVDLHTPERILSLESQIEFLIKQQTEAMQMIKEMGASQKKFNDDIQEFMGFRKKMEDRLAKESKGMFQ